MRIRTETYLRTDIENALKAVAVTGLAFAFAKENHSEDHDAFLRGFTAALTAVAIAFDVDCDLTLPATLPQRNR